MKFSRELKSTGRLALRKNEERGQHEHAQLKDTSLHKAAVCLQCTKKEVHRDGAVFSGGG